MPDHMSLQDLHTQYSCQGDGMCQVSLQFILNTFFTFPQMVVATRKKCQKCRFDKCRQVERVALLVARWG